MDTARAVEFARSAKMADAPNNVETQLKARVLDTLAAITAGYRQEGVDTARQYAIEHLGEGQITLLDTSRDTVSVSGGALANGVAANALDIDDGHREVKGHPAAVVVPPALAAAEAVDASIRHFLNAVFVGYELAVRAGLAIHTVDETYTGTGSWGTLGAAAAVARLCEFSTAETTHALGVAEYHAPRTPIMRGVENPGMTKDGIGWGAYTGAVSAQLAEMGFTGSGTVFDEASMDDTLHDVFHVTEGYFKPYPCCRWAQPGVEAVLRLMAQHDIDPASVRSVHVSTFEEAVQLQTRKPQTPAEAQYSYAYPVAAALLRGRFTQSELSESTREDSDILAIADRVEFAVDTELDRRFPEECLARVAVRTTEGTYRSPVTASRGSRSVPLSVEERLEKARRLVSPAISATAVERLSVMLENEGQSIKTLLAPWE
ncbi:MmgE/PrpD family protein [Natronococcus sp. A-GB1]|uniref:MmgE/PrpD family protein n=1 Tax=Natronococcus sp. A-GB1 TaxID=3037648 RepID=UPI00241F703C|nr:MmgE/PrpD family protein [Natronococcus sp. A-GB1]MDG5762111.1 MmgE/PrpD family protein [Natronococcus sp. A-GB1]